METLAEFALRRSASVAEAATLLATPGARAIAGGTDLVVNLRRGLEKPAILVDLAGVPGLDAFSWSGAGCEIGACVTVARLAGDERVRKELPVLAQAAQAVAAPAHRSAATLGGNLCLDTRCVYYNQSEGWRRSNGYCLKRGGDTCHVAPRGKRCHAAFSGDVAPALLALEPGEFIVRVRVPRPALGVRAAYRKVRLRGSIDFPLAGVAVALACTSGRLEALRIALTGTNPRPLLVSGTEELVGKQIDESLLARLSKLVQKQAGPVRTTLAQANYRRQVAAVTAQRLVKELAAL